MRRLVFSAIVALATIVILILLWEFRIAIVLFALSLALAATVRPSTEFWVRKGLGRGLAILLTYILTLLVIGGTLYLITPPLLRELTIATDNFISWYERITLSWPAGTAFQQSIAGQLPKPEDLYGAIAGERGTNLIRNIIGIAQGFFTVMAQLAVVLVLSIYWSADQVRFQQLWLALIPAHNRTKARAIWREIETGVGAYIRSEATQMFLAAVLLGIGYAVIGSPYPVMLSIVSALMWLIPWAGAILAVIFPVIASLNLSLSLAIAAGIYTLIVLLVLEVVVEPRIFDRRRYSSLLIVLIMVAMTDAFGLVGMIISPPLAAALQILFRNLLRPPAPAPVIAPAEQIENLQTRLEKVKERISSLPESPGPEVVSWLSRLDNVAQIARQEYPFGGAAGDEAKGPEKAPLKSG